MKEETNTSTSSVQVCQNCPPEADQPWADKY